MSIGAISSVVVVVDVVVVNVVGTSVVVSIARAFKDSKVVVAIVVVVVSKADMVVKMTGSVSSKASVVVSTKIK